MPNGTAPDPLGWRIESNRPPSASESETLPSPTNVYPWYSPRFWHGMRAGHYAKLLAEGKFRVSPSRWAMAAAIGGFSVLNSLGWATQKLFRGKQIDAVRLEHPPLFIIGHWRSGTTLLHEYLVRDPQLAFPTTYECFAPTHFLMSSAIVPRWFGFVMPARRPMDDMATGFERPQEDEFALCALGAPTPYRRVAFPNAPPPCLDFLDMLECDPAERKRFERTLEWFVKAVTLRAGGRRLVLKSPPHTGRIGTLARLFPGARFVHITRHPYEIFPSTCRLWRSLDDVQAFDRPRYDEAELQEYVLTCFERMYRGFEAQRDEIAPDHLIEVRYDELIRSPLDTVRLLYDRFGLGDFEGVAPAMREFAGSQREYRPNRHQLDPALAEQVRRRWHGYFERYGYDDAIVE